MQGIKCFIILCDIVVPSIIRWQLSSNYKGKSNVKQSTNTTGKVRKNLEELSTPQRSTGVKCLQPLTASQVPGSRLPRIGNAVQVWKVSSWKLELQLLFQMCLLQRSISMQSLLWQMLFFLYHNKHTTPETSASTQQGQR